MATAAQLQQELINAVTKVRLGDGSPVQVKFSDGKTRTVYRDGSGAEDLPGVNSGSLTDQFNAAEAAARPKPAAQPAPQATTLREVVPPPVQQTTPVAQVAPASNAGGYQLPTLNQSLIDKQFRYGKDRSNELTVGNSDIRDQIYNAGWKEKSDAVRVLTGAANYGIVSGIEGMGGTGFKNLQGGVASNNDFIAAAKAAGIDPNNYQKSGGTSLGSIGSKVLDKEAIYKALQEKGKDLYIVTNAIEGAKRGDAALHATVTYKPDGSGNLVPVNNAVTGQPDVKYFEATRYNEAPGFFEEYGPFLALLPAVGGILQAQGILPAFGTSGTAAGTAGGGFVGGGYGSVGPAGFANAAAIGAGDLTAALNASNVAGSPSSWAATNEAIGLGTSPVGTLGPGIASTIGGAALGAGGGAAGSQLANALNTGAIVSGVGAGLGALASYSGAQMQADAAKEAAANQMSMFNTVNKQLAPQRGAGYQALNQIRSMLPGQSIAYDELGNPVSIQTGNDYLTRQFTPQDLQAGLAPNYNFMLQQGQNLNQRQANVGGGAISGNTLQGLEKFTQDYAGNAYQNAFQNFNTQRTGIYNTLAGIAGLGQQANTASANANQAATTAQGQLGVGSAAAQAAGLTGASNALAGGLQNYQQNQILQAVLGQNQNIAQQQNQYSNINV
jgi:hypothetical protein